MTCPKCRKAYQIGPEHVGLKVRCKDCGTRLLITKDGLSAEPSSAPKEPPPTKEPADDLPAGVTAYTYFPPPPPPPTVHELDSDPDPGDHRPVRRRRRRERSGNLLWDFFTFRLMLTPYLIQILFALGLVAGIYFAMLQTVGAFADASSRSSSTEPTRRSVTSLRVPNEPTDQKLPDKSAERLQRAVERSFLIFVGLVVFRILCEQVIVIFKIHDELKEQTDRQRL